MESSDLGTDTAGGLGGVLPVVQMPFHPDESIDFDTLRSEVDYLLSRGADGVTLAMVSEILRLTTAERMTVADMLCGSVRGRGTCVISCGAESTFAAVEFARHAQAVGASAVMAIPPVTTAVLADELCRYFDALVTAVELPIVVQDASGYVGAPIGVGPMAEIMRRFGPERIYFKPEAVPIGPQLTALREATSGQARVFEGSGGIALVDSYRRGIVGTMPGADLIDAIVGLWQALRRGDDDAAYEISLPLSSLVSLQSGLDGFLAVEKYLLCRQGVFRNEVVRGPVGFRLDEETRQEVDRLYCRLEEVLSR